MRDFDGDPREWDAFVRTAPSAHFSHLYEWMRLIAETYGGEALYLAARDGSELVGVAPVMLRRVVGEGRVIYATPFADEGGLCAANAEAESRLIDHIVDLGRSRGAGYLEVRQRRPLGGDYPCDQSRVTLDLPLPADVQTLWESLSKNMRKKVRRSERDGLVSEVGGREHLGEFYRIYAANMQELGSPMHSPQFFAGLFERFGDNVLTVLVRVDETREVAGAAVALRFRRVLAVLCAHSDRAHLHLFPNNLLYWALLDAAIGRGCTVADFGRSPRGTGIYEFKKSWHMEEHQLYYTRVPICAKPEVGERREGAVYRLFRALWPRLPGSVARAIGPRIWARLPI